MRMADSSGQYVVVGIGKRPCTSFQGVIVYSSFYANVWKLNIHVGQNYESYLNAMGAYPRHYDNNYYVNVNNNVIIAYHLLLIECGILPTISKTK